MVLRSFYSQPFETRLVREEPRRAALTEHSLDRSLWPEHRSSPQRKDRLMDASCVSSPLRALSNLAPFPMCSSMKTAVGAVVHFIACAVRISENRSFVSSATGSLHPRLVSIQWRPPPGTAWQHCEYGSCLSNPVFAWLVPCFVLTVVCSKAL